MVTDRRVRDILGRHKLIALDTSAFIYFVERHAEYGEFCSAVFRQIEAGRVSAVTSTLTLLELLVAPYQTRNEHLALKYYSLFTTYPNLAWLPMTADVADLAAQLRAEHRLKTPDSIQAASAVISGASAFVCNDAVFLRVRQLECLLLKDIIGAEPSANL